MVLTNKYDSDCRDAIYNCRGSEKEQEAQRKHKRPEPCHLATFNMASNLDTYFPLPPWDHSTQGSSKSVYFLARMYCIIDFLVMEEVCIVHFVLYIICNRIHIHL